MILAATAMALAAAGSWAGEADLRGAGSSAAAPIYRSWAEEYAKSGGAALNYEPSGSSAGLRRIRAREVDFGASDVAPPAEELARDGLVVFPIAITGIVPVVNLPRLGAGQLRLSGEVLARIFLGEIREWNDAAIAQLNPGLPLPKLPIRVVVRSDGSGTTYNFTDYLAKVSPAWKAARGVGTRVNWQDGAMGAKGSGGVVAAVKETPAAIGYVDYGYVEANHLNPVQIRNAEGDFVAATNSAFRTALNHSGWIRQGDFTSTLTNQPGKGAWPLTMGTFALVPQVSDRPQETQRALKFFVWAFTHGDALVARHSFVRLPDRVQAAAFKAISSVRDQAGNPIGMVF